MNRLTPVSTKRTAPNIDRDLNRRNFTLATLAGLATLGLAACSDKATDASASSASSASATAAPAGGDKLSPKDAYELASKSNGFTIGALMAANTVYVFFDTTCPHCAELWGASKPLLGKLKMTWIPVGLLRPSSGPQGGTILAAADPSAAMAENEASVLARNGGITANPALGADIVEKVKVNTDNFMRLGADSVPMIVFKNARTGEYGSHAGSLETAQLAELAGV